jgi:4-hydroxy-tetrahydrodipicolinate synthase
LGLRGKTYSILSTEYKNMNLSGVFAALGTPQTGHDEVDEPGLRRLTRYVLDGGLHGVLVNGSMGAFGCLTDREQVRAVSVVVSEVAGAVPVLAGVGETGTRRAREKVEQLTAAGADAVAILPPIFGAPDQPQLRAFYSDLADASDIPVLIYDNPVRTQCFVQPETIAELHNAHPNLVGVKESNQDCLNLQQLLTVMRPFPSFAVMTGSESLMLAGLRMGCHGSIGGLHNLCPRTVAACYQALLDGDMERATSLQEAMNRIGEVFRFGAIWGGFDEALRYLGICERASGGPFTTALTPEEAAQVRSILRQNLDLETAPVE